jgi:hypothetical protein
MSSHQSLNLQMAHFDPQNLFGCVGVLNRRLVNLWIARLGLDGELGGRKDVYRFGQNVPSLVHGGLLY